MTNIAIHLTLTEIITSFILYGIVHGVWTAVKWCMKQLETEAGRIIMDHVKSGHKDRLKDCLKDSCAIPEIAPDYQVHQVPDSLGL